MKLRSFIVLGLAAGLLSACATPTPYQAATTAGASVTLGFKEQKLENNRYRIVFGGNSLTSRETVETYLLYRAAELTLENGYDGFEVVNRDTDEQKRTTITRTRDPYGSPFGWRYYRGGWGDWGGYSHEFMDERTRYEASAEIVMFKGQKDDTNANAYDARQLIENLGPSIQRPEAK